MAQNNITSNITLEFFYPVRNFDPSRARTIFCDYLKNRSVNYYLFYNKNMIYKINPSVIICSRVYTIIS